MFHILERLLPTKGLLVRFVTIRIRSIAYIDGICILF